MNGDNEHIHIEFHSKANAIFFSLLKSFELSAKKINRKNQEYQFQELKNKYINTLKLDLESCALFLIAKQQQSRQVNELNQSLQRLIKEYLHSFLQKTKSD